MKKKSKTAVNAKKSGVSSKKTDKKLVTRSATKGVKSAPKKSSKLSKPSKPARVSKLAKPTKAVKSAKPAKKAVYVKVAKKVSRVAVVPVSRAAKKPSPKAVAVSKMKHKTKPTAPAKGKVKPTASTAKMAKKTVARVASKISKVVKQPLSRPSVSKAPIKKTSSLTKTVAQTKQPVRHAEVVTTPIEATTTVATPVIAAKGLPEGEWQSFRDRLTKMRARLRGDVDAMTDAALNKNSLDASNDNSTMPIHMADVGSDNYEQEQTLSFMQSESGILRRVEDALAKIKEGTYGICEMCECQIPKVRLQAIPYAAYCVRCAEQLESR